MLPKLLGELNSRQGSLVTWFNCCNVNGKLATAAVSSGDDSSDETRGAGGKIFLVGICFRVLECWVGVKLSSAPDSRFEVNWAACRLFFAISSVSV